ncbi:hypothetical protein QQ39_09490 [Pragia fontium]|nr:hypothetical protein QQ39_09490 [Pragia fontium]
MNELAFFTHDSFIDLLNKFSLEKNNIEVFFTCLYACRKLEAVGFFSSTDGDKEIEDKLLYTPRPAREYFNIYREI